MGGCLKELDLRVKLPWKADPREARRLYMQIWRSNDPEKTLREINRLLKSR